MPNYVMNRLKLSGTEEEVKEVMDYIRADNGERIDFNKIVPIPPHIFTGNLGREHTALFGDDTWYEWCPMYWGTKWNAMCKDDADKCTEDTIYFQTAWAGIPKLVYLLSAKFRKVNFHYSYADEDAGYNCERYIIVEGFASDHDKPTDGSKEAYDLYQSLWNNDSYYWDEEKGEMAYKA